MNEIKSFHLPIEQTLLKRNNILRMVVLEEQETIDGEMIKLSADSLKLYNFLYLKFQFNRDKIIESKNYELTFTHNTLIEELGIKNKNYRPIIKKSLQSLRKINVSIKNFIDETDTLVGEFETGLISAWNDHMSKEDNKTKCYKIRIDKTLFNEMMKKKSEYTKIDMKNMKALSSANYIRLYEFIKSYQNMKITPWHTMKELNDLFMTSFKYQAQLEKIIKRAVIAINKDTDLKISYEKDKKTKRIKFNITSIKKTTDEDKKQKYAIKQNIEEKEIIDSLMNNK